MLIDLHLIGLKLSAQVRFPVSESTIQPPSASREQPTEWSSFSVEDPTINKPSMILLVSEDTEMEDGIGLELPPETKMILQ